MKTADLYDRFGEDLRVMDAGLVNFGGRTDFAGPVETLKTFEDNTKVRTILSEPGEGRVLVVDGGGSLRFALLGDQLAALAVQNNWAGLVINGPVRDAADIATMDLGVKALGTIPRKTPKRDLGERSVPLEFADIRLQPGEYLYSDGDGVVVLPEKVAD